MRTLILLVAVAVLLGICAEASFTDRESRIDEDVKSMPSLDSILSPGRLLVASAGGFNAYFGSGEHAGVAGNAVNAGTAGNCAPIGGGTHSVPFRFDSAHKSQPQGSRGGNRATRFMASPPHGSNSVADAVYECTKGDLSRCGKYKVQGVTMCHPLNRAPGCSMFSTALVPRSGALSLLGDRSSFPAEVQGLRHIPFPKHVSDSVRPTAGVVVEYGAGEGRGAPSQLQLLGKHTMNTHQPVSGRSANSIGASVANGGPLSRSPSPLVLHPPSLNIPIQPLCQPSISQVEIKNTGSKPVTLYSTTTESPDFHPALFDDARAAPLPALQQQGTRPQHTAQEYVVLEPKSSVMMSVVFLPRVVGAVNATLVIQSSLGGFFYDVSGVGVPSPFGLEPLDAGRIPLGSRFGGLIRFLNPLAEFVQVTEMFSSTGFVSLGIPRARSQDGLWTVRPHRRRGLADVQFYAAEIGRYEDFIHVAALGRRSEAEPWVPLGFVVPFSATVVAAHVHSTKDVLRFGVLTNSTEKRTLFIELLNANTFPVQVMDIMSISSDSHLEIEFSAPVTLPPSGSVTTVGTASFLGSGEGLFRGTLLVKTDIDDPAHASIAIPYSASVIHGSLGYSKAATVFPLIVDDDKTAGAMYRTIVRKLDFRNMFDVPVAIFRAQIDERFPMDLISHDCFAEFGAPVQQTTSDLPLGNLRAHLDRSDGRFVTVQPGDTFSNSVVVEFFPRATKLLTSGQRYARLLKIFTNLTTFAVPLCIFDSEFDVLIPDSSQQENSASPQDSLTSIGAIDFPSLLVDEQDVRVVGIYNSFPVALHIIEAHAKLADGLDALQVLVALASRDDSHVDACSSAALVDENASVVLAPGATAFFAVCALAHKPVPSACLAGSCSVIEFRSELFVDDWKQHRITNVDLGLSADYAALDLVIDGLPRTEDVVELSSEIYFGLPVLADIFVHNTHQQGFVAHTLTSQDSRFRISMTDAAIPPRSDLTHIGRVMAALDDPAPVSQFSAVAAELTESQVAQLLLREELWRELFLQQQNLSTVLRLVAHSIISDDDPIMLEQAVLARYEKPTFIVGFGGSPFAAIDLGFVEGGESVVLPLLVHNPTPYPVSMRICPFLVSPNTNAVVEIDTRQSAGDASFWSKIAQTFFGYSERAGERTSGVPFALTFTEHGPVVTVAPGEETTVGSLEFAAPKHLTQFNFQIFIRNNVTVAEVVDVIAESGRFPLVLRSLATSSIVDKIEFSRTLRIDESVALSFESFANQAVLVKRVILVDHDRTGSSCDDIQADGAFEKCLRTLRALDFQSWCDFRIIERSKRELSSNVRFSLECEHASKKNDQNLPGQKLVDQGLFLPSRWSKPMGGNLKSSLSVVRLTRHAGIDPHARASLWIESDGGLFDFPIKIQAHPLSDLDDEVPLTDGSDQHNHGGGLSWLLNLLIVAIIGVSVLLLTSRSQDPVPRTKVTKDRKHSKVIGRKQEVGASRARSASVGSDRLSHSLANGQNNGGHVHSDYSERLLSGHVVALDSSKLDDNASDEEWQIVGRRLPKRSNGAKSKEEANVEPASAKESYNQRASNEHKVPAVRLVSNQTSPNANAAPRPSAKPQAKRAAEALPADKPAVILPARRETDEAIRAEAASRPAWNSVAPRPQSSANRIGVSLSPKKRPTASLSGGKAANNFGSASSQPPTRGRKDNASARTSSVSAKPLLQKNLAAPKVILTRPRQASLAEGSNGLPARKFGAVGTQPSAGEPPDSWTEWQRGAAQADVNRHSKRGGPHLQEHKSVRLEEDADIFRRSISLNSLAHDTADSLPAWDDLWAPSAIPEVFPPPVGIEAEGTFDPWAVSTSNGPSVNGNASNADDFDFFTYNPAAVAPGMFNPSMNNGLSAFDDAPALVPTAVPVPFQLPTEANNATFNGTSGRPIDPFAHYDDTWSAVP